MCRRSVDTLAALVLVEHAATAAVSECTPDNCAVPLGEITIGSVSVTGGETGFRLPIVVKFKGTTLA